jgi:hypothetical protein
MPEFVVQRTIDITPTLIVELRVTHSTAVLWAPQFANQAEVQRALAAGQALREAYDLLEARGITVGRWRFTWSGPRVDVEPA